MSIRLAKTDDLPQLFDLYKGSILDRELLYDRNYRYRVQKDGFLLGLDTKKDLEQLIADSGLFLVSEEQSEILGYVITNHSVEFLDDKYKTWFDEEIKTVYYKSPKSISIHTLAVHPNYRSTGVASRLLLELEKTLKEQGIKYLFSVISLSPLANRASLLFHTRHCFKRLAMSSPRKLFELDNYSSVLMYKKI